MRPSLTVAIVFTVLLLATVASGNVQDTSEHFVEPEDTELTTSPDELMQKAILLADNFEANSQELSELYEQIIELNLAEGLYRYAAFFKFGMPGFSQNRTMWLWALNKSAELGFPPAQFEYGLWLASNYPRVPEYPHPMDLSPEVNVAEAGPIRKFDRTAEVIPGEELIYLQLAANADEVRAVMTMASHYLIGDRVPQSCTSAANLYLKAAMLLLKSDLFNPNGTYGSLFLEGSALFLEDVDHTALQYYSKYLKRSPRAERADQVSLLRMEAERGTAEANRKLGQLANQGLYDTAKDPEAGKILLEKASRTGDAEAHAQLGFWYIQNAPSDDDDLKQEYYAHALKYFRMAVAGDSPRGLAGLGLLYFEGLGVEKSETEAAKFFKLAAAAGDTLGKHLYAMLLLRGTGGVEKDVDHAVALFAEASKEGHFQATVELGRVLAFGDGGRQPDCNRGVRYLKKAAEYIWERQGLNTAHDLYLSGSYERAADVYSRLAHLGFARAAASLAFMQREGYIDNTPAELHRTLHRAALLGHDQSYVDMARVLIKNNDYEGALPWLRDGVSRGIAECAYLLGYMYEGGLGVERDYVLAKRHYDSIGHLWQTDDDGFVTRIQNKWVATLSVLRLRLHGLYLHFTEGMPLGSWWFGEAPVQTTDGPIEKGTQSLIEIMHLHKLSNSLLKKELHLSLTVTILITLIVWQLYARRDRNNQRANQDRILDNLRRDHHQHRAADQHHSDEDAQVPEQISTQATHESETEHH